MMEKLWEAAQAYNEQVLFLERLARYEPPRAFIISPDEMLPARLITRDRKKINRTVDLGYQKVQKIEHHLRDFLYEIPEARNMPTPRELSPDKMDSSLHA